MFTKDGVEYRNLVEQVQQNQSDIQYLLKEGGTLNEFGIKVVGQVTAETDLPDPETYGGEYGDAYAVGAESPYAFYIYTRQISGQASNFWFNVGLFPQPSTVPGPTGPTGPQGQQGARGSLWFTGSGAPAVGSQYQTGDMYLNQSDGSTYRLENTGNWQRYNSIRGPQGIQGVQGETGERGQTGSTGPQGPKGEQGAPFTVVGIVASVEQLPTPTAETANQGYLVGTAENYDLYVSTGTAEAGFLWANTGKVEGVEGPTGPQGQTGATGPQGEPGVTKPIYYYATNLSGVEIIFNGDPLLSPATPAPSADDLIIDAAGNVARITLSDEIGMDFTILYNLKGEAGASPSGITLSGGEQSGTLTADQLSTLQANDFNYITLDNEIYNLQDKDTIGGYLVYTHVGGRRASGSGTVNNYIKSIYITISNREWSLSSRLVGGYLCTCMLTNGDGGISFSYRTATNQPITTLNRLIIALSFQFGTSRIAAGGVLASQQVLAVSIGTNSGGANELKVWTVTESGSLTTQSFNGSGSTVYAEFIEL